MLFIHVQLILQYLILQLILPLQEKRSVHHCILLFSILLYYVSRQINSGMVSREDWPRTRGQLEDRILWSWPWPWPRGCSALASNTLSSNPLTDCNDSLCSSRFAEYDVAASLQLFLLLQSRLEMLPSNTLRRLKQAHQWRSTATRGQQWKPTSRSTLCSHIWTECYQYRPIQLPLSAFSARAVSS